MTNDEELLVKILKLSHSQVMAGKSYSQEEAEQFLDQRLSINQYIKKYLALR